MKSGLYCVQLLHDNKRYVFKLGFTNNFIRRFKTYKTSNANLIIHSLAFISSAKQYRIREKELFDELINSGFNTMGKSDEIFEVPDKRIRKFENVLYTMFDFKPINLDYYKFKSIISGDIVLSNSEKTPYGAKHGELVISPIHFTLGCFKHPEYCRPINDDMVISMMVNAAEDPDLFFGVLEFIFIRVKTSGPLYCIDGNHRLEVIRRRGVPQRIRAQIIRVSKLKHGINILYSIQPNAGYPHTFIHNDSSFPAQLRKILTQQYKHSLGYRRPYLNIDELISIVIKLDLQRHFRRPRDLINAMMALNDRMANMTMSQINKIIGYPKVDMIMLRKTRADNLLYLGLFYSCITWISIIMDNDIRE